MAESDHSIDEKELGSGAQTPNSRCTDHIYKLEDKLPSMSDGFDADGRPIEDTEPKDVARSIRPTLTRIITGRSVASSWKDPGPPPDGGVTAWTQAVMAHIVISNTWGYMSSYGVFQAYYVTALGRSPSDISWVGSVQMFLVFMIGTFSGRALDYGLFRPIFVTGFCLHLSGMFMTSLCTQYWQLFLAQGLCTGIGSGLMFCPTMSLLSTYFSKKRALAIGIAASGSCTGGLIYPIIVQQLLPRIGFGWTVRVLGFFTLGAGIPTVVLLKSRLPPRKSGPLVEFSAFKELPYTLFLVGMFLNFWGLFFAFYYVSAYGRDIIGFTYTDSITLLLIMNGVGLIGRILPNHLSDRFFGPLNTIIPFAFASGILLFGWAGVTSRGGLYAFAVVYGLSSAGMQGMFPAALSSLTTDLRRQGVRMGMGFSIVSVACLTGPPLAGALIQRNGGSYLYAQMWAGAVLICGGCTLCAARTAKVGWTLWTRV
ncbi:hypothetical protein H2201_001963 [Coniosporium apollinis]|uniref:Major facilitator superfamily (MFS) profile domain-containing protein n=1 Tax=Coniosporium apollinis TaxID=61459 RepID=A0ABQ9P5X0_9PEZI|nr:hypothetical protein H2201_001963 [Coniosporium apollinis]